MLSKELEKLREKSGLPNVVFHSLCHSSTAYKLKLNPGNLEALVEQLRKSPELANTLATLLASAPSGK